MTKSKDPMWSHVTKDGSKLKCNYCKKVYSCTITRMKSHLGRIPHMDIELCNVSPESVMQLARSVAQELGRKRGKTKGINEYMRASVDNSQVEKTSTKQLTLNAMLRKKEKEEADLEIARMVIANNLSFNLLRSPEFINAMEAVARHGPGYVPPSSETVRTKLLSKLKQEAGDFVTEVRESWAESGCTIMSDCWMDNRHRNHINLLAASSMGTVFLCSESTEGKVKDAAFIYDFIKKGIDEHVGRENVVQIVADNGSNYSAAGVLLEIEMPHVFKTNCAAHCIDLILEDMDKLPSWKIIISDARSLVRFLYGKQHVLALMRRHMNNRELKRPAATRFATNFLMIQSLINEEQALRFMVASQEWRNLVRPVEGDNVVKLINSDVFWSDAKEMVTTVEPLIKVLRMADGEEATVGYLYEAMQRSKDSIATFYKNEESRYKVYWDIIDARLKKQLHNPLMAAAGLLNPHLYFDKLVKHDDKTDKGVMEALKKMVPPEDHEAFSDQLADYIALQANIFTPFARSLLHKKHPCDWWKVVNPAFAQLKKIAVKLLSQPCSSSACERNWSAFEAAHTKKRNKLDPKTLNDLVFARVNLHMKKMKEKLGGKSEPLYLEKFVAFPELLSTPNAPAVPNVPDTATTTATIPMPLGQGVVNIEDDDIDYAENDGDDVDLDYDDIQHDYAAPHFLFD